MNAVIAEVAAERARQIAAEGWTLAHDDDHREGELAIAAAVYAAPIPLRAEIIVPCGCRSVGDCPHAAFPKTKWGDAWPFDGKPKRKDRRRDLIRAAALIVAEIERIDRAMIAAKDRG